jgi:hypothetical protein
MSFEINVTGAVAQLEEYCTVTFSADPLLMVGCLNRPVGEFGISEFRATGASLEGPSLLSDGHARKARRCWRDAKEGRFGKNTLSSLSSWTPKSATSFTNVFAVIANSAMKLIAELSNNPARLISFSAQR